MNEGAFALLDCLGFKGVWNRGVTPEAIVKFMEESKREAENSQMRRIVALVFGTKVRVSTAFVSDSIAISISPTQSTALTDWEKGYILSLAVLTCLEFMKRFIGSEAPVPMPFRGCISYGPHIVQDTFFLGPAVDEAASFSQVAQGAFVWMTPEAHRYYTQYMRQFPAHVTENLSKMSPDELLQPAKGILSLIFEMLETLPQPDRRFRAQWESATEEKKRNAARFVLQFIFSSWRQDIVIENYAMELKSGGVLRVAVLNLFSMLKEEEYASVIRRILSGFDTSKTLDVLIKRQNTQRLLWKGATDASEGNRRIRELTAEYEAKITAALG